MKIINLKAENFKRLVAVEITPDGNVVEIAGRNGQGKTSVLDAIWVTLAGLSVAPAKPIRKGAEEARIRLDLGEIIVTRTFKQDGETGKVTSSLKVENADGSRYGSPQAVLDKLMGALTFDPLAFARMQPKQQFDALRGLVPGFDFGQHDRLQADDFERRRALNAKAREAGNAAALIATRKPMPRMDESALVADLEAAGKHNADIETRKANRERLSLRAQALRKDIKFDVDAIENDLKQITALQARIEETRARNLSRDKEATEIEVRIEAAGALAMPIDTAAITAKITEARLTNSAIDEDERNAKRKAELHETAKRYEQQSEELTLTMQKREEEKVAAISAAKLPVNGMALGKDEVLINDIPFSQASDAEQLRVSIAMAMAMNPKLRVIRVRDGSLLDDESMRLLATMATDRDYQVWIERVDSSGKVGIVLEDGHIKREQA